MFAGRRRKKLRKLENRVSGFRAGLSALASFVRMIDVAQTKVAEMIEQSELRSDQGAIDLSEAIRDIKVASGVVDGYEEAISEVKLKEPLTKEDIRNLESKAKSVEETLRNVMNSLDRRMLDATIKAL